MALRRDLNFQEIPALKMAKTLHEGLIKAASEPSEESKKTEPKENEAADEEKETPAAEPNVPALGVSLDLVQFKSTMMPLKPEYLDDKTYNKKLEELFNLLDLNHN
jgi:hypothetical protein